MSGRGKDIPGIRKGGARVLLCDYISPTHSPTGFISTTGTKPAIRRLARRGHIAGLIKRRLVVS